jgi:CrcB protein
LKGIEIVMLAAGALIRVFLRYKLVESPVVLGGLEVNVLIVNVIGSFRIGLFSVLALAFNLDAKYVLLATRA